MHPYAVHTKTRSPCSMGVINQNFKVTVELIFSHQCGILIWASGWTKKKQTNKQGNNPPQNPPQETHQNPIHHSHFFVLYSACLCWEIQFHFNNLCHLVVPTKCNTVFYWFTVKLEDISVIQLTNKLQHLLCLETIMSIACKAISLTADINQVFRSCSYTFLTITHPSSLPAYTPPEG